MTPPVETTSAALAAAVGSLTQIGPAWSCAPDAARLATAARSGLHERLLDDNLLAEQVRVIAGLDEEAPRATGADAASVLWARFLKFDAADPCWPDRDRFVLSPGHGAALQRALLQVTGTATLSASATGQPTPGGEGLGAAVGMAMAERFLAARFGRTLVDHRTWVLATDGDLMQGVSHEAASLAGQLQLERLTVLWDAAVETEAGRRQPGAPAGTEHTLRRFAAYGWMTKSVACDDHAAIAAALGAAMRARKPTLIATRAAAGGTAPRRLSTAVEAAVMARWQAAGHRGSGARRSWLKRLAHHARRAEFERATAGLLPDALDAALQGVTSTLAGASGIAPREASERVLAAIQSVLPDLVGGVADAAAQRPTAAWRSAGSFAARFLHFGSREHGMAAAMNGMAAHGGVLPYGGTAGAWSESMRPALRLAALMRQRVVHVLSPDARPEAAGGPAPRSLEQLASLRAVPNLHVLRPADAVETAECWELALRRDDGPSLLVLGCDPTPRLRGVAPANRCAEGGYVLAEADGERRATLIATGAEVGLALLARSRLAAERIAVAVVSLPCWDLFARAGAAHHARVLGEAMRFGIEAGCGFGWERWLGPDGIFIGCETGDAASELTTEAIVAMVRRCLAA